MEHVEITIIGGGVIGLAVARALALQGRQCCILEQHPQTGFETSSRNSEVIHAGIYYPTDSLKARLCVQGKGLLYDYCEKQQIAHQRCGKLIVACDAREAPQLRSMAAQAKANGVEDLRWLSATETRAIEPEVNAHNALWSPSTGIIDSHELLQNLQHDAERHGAILLLDTQVTQLTRHAHEFIIGASTSGQSYEFCSQHVINCAGLHAQKLAALLHGHDPSLIPPIHYCKGHYFSLADARPFKHLIYPIPEQNATGLGIHATLTLDGQVRFGPDAQYVDELDYSVPEELAERYYRTIRRYYPALADHSLHSDYAGIRPKLQAAGGAFEDFRFYNASHHGIPGLLHCFGIESPGLTASLAIAEHVINRLI